MTEDRFAVEHRTPESRYVLIDRESDDAVIGEESYVDVGDERVLFHTLVSDDYGGRGLASRLVSAVVDDVVAHGKVVVPVCPYVKTWLPKHPEHADHAVAVRPEHLRAVSRRPR
ncbi:GNAT family N-acetyltransferase [Microbacterium karelineae]|uniref:GNAT family N-acetyltransferase n=1 Tax=Microbacterium karelineae TaxID=2654283 RepID=UPI0012EA6A9C|nr:GNAT family N-acetyltransferase [Microbacterium karelineae]